jgi:hypothetical protein
MCVIMVAQDKPLSRNMLKKAVARNKDGIGFAWLDGDKVRFKKGISLKEAQSLRNSLPLPYVFHARFTTEGKTIPELCHPFPVTRANSRRTNGKFKRVLFHNGTWKAWDSTVKTVEQRYSVTLPSGPMSDSRAMAFVVSVLGVGVLDMPHGQRYAILDADGPHLFGKGWSKWNGYWVSNTRWADPPKVVWKSKALGLRSGLAKGNGKPRLITPTASQTKMFSVNDNRTFKGDHDRWKDSVNVTGEDNRGQEMLKWYDEWLAEQGDRGEDISQLDFQVEDALSNLGEQDREKVLETARQRISNLQTED